MKATNERFRQILVFKDHWLPLFFSLLVFAVPASVIAATPPAGRTKPLTPTSSESGEISVHHAISVDEAATFTKEDVTAYLSGLIPLQLQRGDLAGAAVIVIHDNQVLTEKGYGQADVSRHIAVDPERTMFRFGSVSKLLTYVSAMQLVEQGRLDLDADVNQYLDFKIEPAFDKPITVRNLMTHTAGFELQQQYVIARTEDDPISLRDYLIRYQPRRIYPAGEIGAYSGYGVGLLGYIVQHVSGERFEDYVQHHIFDPLGMAHSTFEQPLPPQFRGLLSQGYLSTAHPPINFEVFNPAPAGGMSSTVSDMARFAQSLLDGGQWQGHQILHPATVQQMWTRQFAVSPLLPAMCMGFYEVDRNGLRFIGHNGDTRVFHTQLEIEPKNHLILISAFNSVGTDDSGQDNARSEIFNGLLDRYFPFKANPKWEPVDANARQIEGTFAKASRVESGRFKIDSLLEQIQISVNQNGQLINRLAADDRGHPIRLRYLGNDLWQDEIGQGRIMALRDMRGHVYGLASMFGATMMVRVPWYENAYFIFPLAALALLISILIICNTLLRRLHFVMSYMGKKPDQPEDRTRGVLTYSQRWAAWIWVPAILVPLQMLQRIARQPLPHFAQIPVWALVQNIMILVAICLSIPGILLAFRMLGQTHVTIRVRILHVGIGVSFLFLTWFSLHWHLLGTINRY